MATLHFIWCKAGAGKTTLARELGRTLPAMAFCEDEWIDTLGFEIRSLDDFQNASSKCRNLIRPLAIELLRLGGSVVFDFAGNAQLPKCELGVRQRVFALIRTEVDLAERNPRT